MKSARVRDFHTILIGLLTQYDQKESLREMKRGGRPNIYRLGHYLEAAQKVEDKAKWRGVEIWERDDANAINTYRNLLTQHFIYESPSRYTEPQFALSPLRQLDKRMTAWVKEGKLPKYGTARDNPWEKVFG